MDIENGKTATETINWHLTKKPHWWKIDPIEDHFALVYWLWDGESDENRSARFWILRCATKEIAKNIADVFFQARIGLQHHREAREYRPGQPFYPAMKVMGAV